MSRSRPPAALTAPVSERPFWSQVLRALRDGQGVSRDGWAAVLGYGRTTVQRWETGENVPDAVAEEAIIAHCRDRGLFQTYDRRCLGGFALTPESLSALLAAARLGSRFMEQTADSTEHSGDLRTNLPYALTSFVGRDRELTAISELLAQTRLLTLAGPGGVGKTRLAMEVGHALLDRYPDGVWLVDLAPLTDGALVPQAAATAVNVRERPGRPVVDALIDGLSDRRLLLVLDNCEHLVAASADLAERVLRACAGVQVLATSREVLGVGGETVVRVPALSVPDASMPAPLGRLAHYDAVRLFVERVRARQLSFALTDATASAVVRVCRRLDGIPLALELAASRVPALSVEQIAGRLDDSFRMLRLLAGGSRATPSRQQTLRGTLDWSYELLSDRERELLCRLAVFAGDFPLDAAEAVGSGDAIGTDEVLDLLSQLIDKSLVNVEQVAGVRYRLLETVRQFALEKLEPDDQAAIRDRHCGWYLALAEEAEPNLVGPEQRVWLAQLEREHDNLRAALAGADECGDAMSLLRLTGALWRFWEVRGHFAEGRSWLERALAGGDDAPARVRAKALTGAGLLARLQDDCPRALHCYEEALALYRSANDGQGTATTLIHLGVVAQRQGQAEQAVCWYEEGLALCQELGDQRRSAITLANLGTLAQQQGKLDEAAVRQDAALALFRRIGDQGGVALALGGLGNVEVERGNYAHAATLIEEALSLFQSLGDQRRIAIGFVNLGDVERARANRGRALRHYAEALRLNRQLGQKEGIAYCLEGAGGVVLDGGDLEPAARLFGAAAALRDSIGIQRPPAERVAYDADVARLRDGLSTEAFNSAWASGGVESTDNAFERWTATTEAAIEADRIETRTEGGR